MGHANHSTRYTYGDISAVSRDFFKNYAAGIAELKKFSKIRKEEPSSGYCCIDCTLLQYFLELGNNEIDRQDRGALKYAGMKVLLLLVIAVSPFATVIGQPRAKPVLVDEFAAMLCSDDIRGRIDAFFAAISQQPGSVGSVVVTPDLSIPGRALKYRRLIENHVGFRHFDPDRVLFSERPFGESRIQLWILPKGLPPAQPVSEPWRISATTLFDAGGIYINPWTRQIEFGEVSDEPCDFGVSFDQFASSLKADKTLFAHLLFSSSGRINRKRANSAVKIAVKHLTDFGVAPNRIKTNFVGSRKYAEMQLWLVPKGGALPAFRKDVVPN